MIPKPNEIRAALPDALAERSLAKALLIFVPSYVLFWVTFFGCLLLEPLWGKIGCSLANGFLISILFVIGHDACHGSLTPHSWLNHILGRIAFWQSLHPFSSWELGHNRLHHCWTNLRGRDYVWTPFSKDEFRELPVYRQLLERFYRSAWGVGAYYFIEIWWRHMVFPRKSDLARIPRVQSILDRLSILFFLAVQVWLIVAGGRSASFLVLLVLGVGVPQAVWNWLMGFVIFHHHTHPQVVWFDDPEEWSFFSSQVRGTVHVVFPKPIGAMLHHIMEHTAHHIDPKVPLYNLPAAQRAIGQAYPADVIKSHFTPREFLRIASICQLYDYQSRQWLDFSGKPTTA